MTARATRIAIVRHGRVAEPWPERLYGDLDVPLSPEGEAQSARVGEAFAGAQLDAVVSSGLARAELCARILREPRGLARRDEPRLREIHRGQWAGWSREQVEAAHPGAWAALVEEGGLVAPPGGETLAELGRRVGEALDALADAHPGGRIAVAAHKWVLRSAVARALGLPLERCARIAAPPVAIASLDWPTAGARAEGRPPVLVALGPAPVLD